MVDPVFIEQEPEPDIEAAIRRRSSLNPTNQPTSDSQEQSPSQSPLPVAAGAYQPSPLPTVIGKDHHRPVLRVRSNSVGSTQNEKRTSGHASGNIRPLPSPESILGLPVHGHAIPGENSHEEEQGMGLNRVETSDTLSYQPTSHEQPDDEAFLEITWKASCIVSFPL